MMSIGHYILFLVGLVSVTGMICIIIDMFITKEYVTHTTETMSKKEREAYFDDDDITNEEV